MNKKSDKILKNVAARFKEERLKQGLSHDKLAEKAGLHRSAISLIESGKRSPTLKNCLNIAEALNIKLSDILKDYD